MGAASGDAAEQAQTRRAFSLKSSDVVCRETVGRCDEGDDLGAVGKMASIAFEFMTSLFDS